MRKKLGSQWIGYDLEPIKDSLSASPEEKRPALHQLIDQLPAEERDFVENLLARLEIDRLWQASRDGFAQDWAAGKYDRLEELIRELRAELNPRAA